MIYFNNVILSSLIIFKCENFFVTLKGQTISYHIVKILPSNLTSKNCSFDLFSSVSKATLERKMEKRRKRREWEQNKERIMYDYDEFSFYGTAVSIYSLRIYWVGSKVRNLGPKFLRLSSKAFQSFQCHKLVTSM